MMKYLFFFFWPGLAFSQTFQLAPPQLAECARFFTDSTVVQLHFDLDGAEIRYTLDGSVPDDRATRYTAPIVLSASCELTARALHPDYLPSESLHIRFVRIDPACQPAQASLAQPPSPKYPGRGVTSLLDGEKAHADPADGRWLGFEGQDLEYAFSLKKAHPVNHLIVSFLSAPGSWIFPPRRIEVWGSRHKNRGYRKVGERVLVEPVPGAQGLEEKMVTVPLLGPGRYRYWRVRVEHYGVLPDGHPGKGQPAWLFVDEIILQP